MKIDDLGRLACFLKLVSAAKFGDDEALREILGSPIIGEMCLEAREEIEKLISLRIGGNKPTSLYDSKEHKQIISDYIVENVEVDFLRTLSEKEQRSYIENWFLPFKIDEELYLETVIRFKK